MMGVTNHWVSLMAHKFNQRIEFYFFDSRNLNYLDWSLKEIKQSIELEN